MNNVILIGNPNVGKTTLFNSLTKSNEKVSNWHGVTVGEKKKDIILFGKKITVTDLPGMYSLEGYSNEEKIANNYIKKHSDDLIVNICDANNLLQNLKLTDSLISCGFNVIVAVNMINENKSLNLDVLRNNISAKVVGIDARKQSGLKELREEIFNYLFNKKPQNTLKISKKQFKYEELSKYLKIYYQNKQSKDNLLDKILLNKFMFLPAFLIAVFSVFYLTFGKPGQIFSDAFVFLFEKFFDILRNLIYSMNILPAIQSLLVEGIINSVSTLISFLPQIILLMFFLNVLEDTGFMSRIAFMFDGLMKRVGLTGKSLFSLFLGFGCTTTAVITTRNLENKSLRKRTVLLLPFSTCSAKLPVMLVISSLFFENYKYLFVFGLYIFALLISFLVALINKKLYKKDDEFFILEMPKYRLPYFKKVIKDTLSVAKEFLFKIGYIIILFGALLWFLQNFSINFEYLNGEDISNSILFFISEKLVPIFSLIGLGNAGVIAVLFFGLFAKELIVVGLMLINGAQNLEMLKLSLISAGGVCSFTPQSSIIFLVFILLYSPCVSALGAIKNEMGLKISLQVLIFQFLISFVVCLILNLTLNKIYYLIALAVFIVLALVLKFVLKLGKKKIICRGKCSGC